MRHPGPRTAIGLIVLVATVSGCSAAGEEVKVDATPYAKPEGWQTECIGRWLVDVPAPIDLGAAYYIGGDYPEFFDYTPAALRESSRAKGGVAIGPVAISESIPLVGVTVPKVFADTKSSTTLNAVQFMSLMLSEHVARGRNAEGFRRFINTPTLGAWAALGEFQVYVLADEDQRGRFYWKDPTQSEPIKPPDVHAGERAELPTPPSAEPLARAVLEQLVPRYGVRKPGQMPKGAGICTPHGFFADPPGGTERDSRVSASFVDPRYANLVLHVEIQTRTRYRESALIPTEDIRKAMTPWEAAEEIAREHKKRCRAQGGTTGGGLFGSCAFAGATGISDHWDVQYLKLANGQEARAMAITYPGSINNYTVYEAIVETAGKKGSVTEPRIKVTAEGIGKLAEDKAFRGKEPPPMQDAFKLAVEIARSLRPRPEAIDPARPVVDPWERFRK